MFKLNYYHSKILNNLKSH